jgi:hypothetical protein
MVDASLIVLVTGVVVVTVVTVVVASFHVVVGATPKFALAKPVLPKV